MTDTITKKSFRVDYEGDFPPSLSDMRTAIDRGSIDEGGKVEVTEIEVDSLREIVAEKIKKIKQNGKRNKH